VTTECPEIISSGSGICDRIEDRECKPGAKRNVIGMMSRHQRHRERAVCQSRRQGTKGVDQRERNWDGVSPSPGIGNYCKYQRGVWDLSCK